MKGAVLAGLVILSSAVFVAEATAAGLSDVVSSRAVSRERHLTVMETVRLKTNHVGSSLLTNRFTILGNGINRLDESGRYVECKPVVTSYPGGMVCTGAAFSVIIGTNLQSGFVDLQTADHQRIVTRPLGIGFYDPASGRSVLLAQVKDCQAGVVSNEIIFRNAFQGSGIEAAVSYTYGVGRFHQDVTFVKRPAVIPADFGLGDRTRLELLTEIVQSPTPLLTEHVLKAETNALLRVSMAEPDVIDQTLKFGEMTMPLGQAFPTGIAVPTQRGLVVAKRLLRTDDNRTVLVESLAWSAAKLELDKLPLATTTSIETNPLVGSTRELPARRPAAKPDQTFDARLTEVTRLRPVTLAALNPRSLAIDVPKGFVADYSRCSWRVFLTHTLTLW